MADNVVVTSGTGTTIAADEIIDGTLGTVKAQYVKLMDGTLDGTSKAAVGANGLAADVKASVLPTGAATAAKQPALGTAGTASADVITVQGIASGTVLPITANASTVPAATTLQNGAGTGNPSGSSLPVTGFAAAILNVVSGTPMSGGTTINFEASVDDVTWVPIAGHAIGTNGSLATTTTADGDFRFATAGYKSLRARISAWSAGVTTVKGYVTPLASQPTAVALAPGTNSIGAVTQTARSVSSQTALTATATVSGAAGRFSGGSFINLNAAPAYIQVFDTTGAVTLGVTVPTFVQAVPANGTPANGAAFVFNIHPGITIANGIKAAATTTATGASTVATALIGYVLYL